MLKNNKSVIFDLVIIAGPAGSYIHTIIHINEPVVQFVLQLEAQGEMEELVRY